MKTYIALLALLAGALSASEPAKVIHIAPGQRVEVRGTAEADFAQSFHGVSFTADDARDVVKALNILLKFAPSKYPEGYTGISGVISTSTTGMSAYTLFGRAPLTKADEVRAEANRNAEAAKSKRADADRIDKEQADIEWARGILKKWEAWVEVLR